MKPQIVKAQFKGLFCGRCGEKVTALTKVGWYGPELCYHCFNEVNPPLDVIKIKIKPEWIERSKI